jgi:hypothetical protein
LIDFDFSGKEDGKCYSSRLDDIVEMRAGKPNMPLKKKDDWTDFLKVMALFLYSRGRSWNSSDNRADLKRRVTNDVNGKDLLLDCKKTLWKLTTTLGPPW